MSHSMPLIRCSYEQVCIFFINHTRYFIYRGHNKNDRFHDVYLKHIFKVCCSLLKALLNTPNINNCEMQICTSCTHVSFIFNCEFPFFWIRTSLKGGLTLLLCSNFTHIYYAWGQFDPSNLNLQKMIIIFFFTQVYVSGTLGLFVDYLNSP